MQAVSVRGQLLGQPSKSLHELADSGHRINAQLDTLSSQMTQVASAPTILNQHSQALQDLASSASQMHTQMDNMTTQLNQVTSALAQLSAFQPAPAPLQPDPPQVPEPAAPPSSPTREPYVPKPERYSGDQGACRDFLMQVSLVFGMQPLTYSTDQQKITYTLSLLTGAKAPQKTQRPSCPPATWLALRGTSRPPSAKHNGTRFFRRPVPQERCLSRTPFARTSSIGATPASCRATQGCPGWITSQPAPPAPRIKPIISPSLDSSIFYPSPSDLGPTSP
uniref:Uncharacterized protein n=1 Tax=Acanthochromis polyacanthus TaxID=80966 RepID=A0A3Q1HYI7_9TELE